MPINTGFNGNEIFCLHKKGFSPGEIVLGNSVHSIGFVGGIGSAFNTLVGGEVTQLTQLIHDGRQSALNKLEAWTNLHGAVGISSVTSELVLHSGNIEFLSIGSAVHRDGYDAPSVEFTSSSNGQELYCQLDAGFTPVHFSFGNVAYSVGLGGGIAGMFRSLGRGEVKEFSELFNTTRHLALQRLQADAQRRGCNCVVGIKTTIMNYNGAKEMVMIGTGSRHSSYGPEFDALPATSDLSCEEMWNLVHIGYLPIQLVLGVSVYSVGFVGGVSAFFQSFVRGEIEELTSLVYDARENALAKIKEDAAAVGADDVVGIKTYVSSLGGGIIEFMTIGTAVKKIPGLTTLSDSLPPQAVMVDQDTFLNVNSTSVGRNLNEGNKR